jgi:membrane-associated protease RseP (regulator of RpoE activity)
MRLRLILLTAGALVIIALMLLIGWMDRNLGAPPEIPKLAGGTSTNLPISSSGSSTGNPEFAAIRCQLEGEAEAGVLEAVGEGSTIRGEGLSLTVPPGEFRIHWIHGKKTRDLGLVELDPGEILSCRIPVEGSIVEGHVYNRKGLGVANARIDASCGSNRLSTTTDADGDWALTMPPDACILIASVFTGLLDRRSDPMEISIFDREVSPELMVDDTPLAGLGISLQMEPEGARILEVVRGTPAEREGLMQGDLIVSVDGEKVAGMTIEEFRSYATGEEGSTVALTRERDGVASNLRVRREQIQSPGSKEDTGEP